MISQMIVVADDVSDFLLKVTWQIIIFEQDAVLQGLMPWLNLALGLRMHGRTAHMFHAFASKPASQLSRDVA